MSTKDFRLLIFLKKVSPSYLPRESSLRCSMSALGRGGGCQLSKSSTSLAQTSFRSLNHHLVHSLFKKKKKSYSISVKFAQWPKQITGITLQLNILLNAFHQPNVLLTKSEVLCVCVHSSHKLGGGLAQWSNTCFGWRKSPAFPVKWLHMLGKNTLGLSLYCCSLQKTATELGWKGADLAQGT